MSAQPEPAIRSYFFGKGYRDLWNTIRESWDRNLASARDHFAKVGDHLGTDETWWAVLWGAAGVSVVVFGTAVFVVASAVHVLILGSFFLLIYLGFTLVYLAEKGYLTWKGFFAVCPDCHGRNPLPEYFCSRCGTVHRRLIPSSYGILQRTCECGERLPTTFFLKRGELQARCPDCETLLSRDHTETRKVFIPVVGGGAVGKSAFLFTAVRELIENRAPAAGLTPEFLDDETEEAFRGVCEGLARGRPPAKTGDPLPRAFNLKLCRGSETPRLLYLYDPAGEAFNATDGMILHKYQAFFSGLVFIVDPFALSEVRREYPTELETSKDALKPSELPVEDVLSRVLISLEESFELGKTAQVRAPLAVVLNKIDAFDLRDRLGEPAIRAWLRKAPAGTEWAEARDRVVRDQLLRWGQAALVHQLEARFARVRYFTCSALGHMPDTSGRAFEPEGILEPLLWILDQADSGLFSDRGSRNGGDET